MKILHIITNTELGGAQRVCIDLCISAVKEGYIVGVASMRGGYLWEQLPQEVKRYELKNMFKEIRPLSEIKVLSELHKVKKDFQPDIIHLHSSKAGVLGRVLGLGMSKRIVYTVHGFDSIRLKYRIFLPLEKILQYFCGAIIAVSEYDQKNLFQEGIRKNISVIHNGIYFEDRIRKEAIPCWYNENKKIVLTIARIAPPKKLEMFLKVAAFFKDSNYIFVWIGGSQEDTIEEIKLKYKVPENVVLTGDIPEANRYIMFSDLFVLFSDFEGLPMTIIEAMSKGKAIIASNVGGISELVDSSNGVLIENKPEKAAEAIHFILNDENRKELMEQNSLDKFKKYFTLDIMWNKYKEIYKKMMEK